MVATQAGICLHPASIEQLRDAVSPIIMSSRKADYSTEIVVVLKLIRQMYRRYRVRRLIHVM